MLQSASSRSSHNRLLLSLVLSTVMLGNALIASLVHCPAMLLSALQNGDCAMQVAGAHHDDEGPESSCNCCQNCVPTATPGLIDTRASHADRLRANHAILPTRTASPDYQRPDYSLYILRGPPA